MKFESNEELKRAVKEGVLNCKGEDLICDFNIDINAHIINARNIKSININACDINACNIDAFNINAGDIDAGDINALNIDAYDITACNIDACDIDARNINYYAVCFAYNNIICDSIKGRRDNSKHFVLSGEIKIREHKDYLIKNGKKYEVKIIKEVSE